MKEYNHLKYMKEILPLKDYPKHEQEPVTADPEFQKESFWARRIPKRLKEKVMAGLMVGMTLLGPNSAEAQKSGGVLKKETTITKSTDRDMGAHWSMTAKGEDGRMYINPFGIFPQIEIFSDTREQREVRFELPYEYSRLFDTGKPLSPEDHQKIADYIEQKFKEEFATKIHDFVLVGSDDIYRAKHGESVSERPKIENIKITGFASPEGPQRKGPDTMAPGNIDTENIDLANKRAETGLDLTEEALEKIGITREQLDETVKSVGAEELQFSSSEMAELAALAASEPGADPLEKIWRLTIKYNKNEIDDPNTKSKLDEIVGAKRKIEVAVTYEDGQKDVYLFMIPWVVLLPFLRRKKNQPDLVPSTPPERLQLPGLVVPPKFKEVLVPDPGSPEYQSMQERASIDDFYVYFGNPDTARRGLDYQMIADNLYTQYDEFGNDAEREEFLAVKILQGWKDHDRAARREAGISEEELDKGLDYENQDDQIRWAKIHARILFKLIQQKREFAAQGKDFTYLELLTPEVVRLIKIKAGESLEGVPAEPEVVTEPAMPTAEEVKTEENKTEEVKQETKAEEVREEVKIEPEKTEDKIENKENRRTKYLEALRKKGETLAAFFAMNAERARSKLSEFDEAALEKYRQLKENWLKKRNESLRVAEELPIEDQEKLAMATRLEDLDLEIQRESSGEDIAGTARIHTETTPEISPAPDKETSVAESGVLNEPEIKVEKPEQEVTLQEAERMLQVSKNRKHMLETAYWESKLLELQERQKAELSPEGKVGRSWGDRIRSAFRRKKAEVVSTTTVSEEVSGTTTTPESERSKQWTVLGWLAERCKGILSAGIWEVRQAWRFQKGTKFTSNDLEALSSLIHVEDADEAQEKANEMLSIMRENNITTVTAPEFLDIAKNVTYEKAAENNDRIEYIVKNSLDTLKERVAKYRGQATAETVLTAGNLKAVEDELRMQLNQFRDGATLRDVKNFARVMRDNMDKKWWLRYIYAPLEASLLGYLGYNYLPWSRWFGGGDLIPGGEDITLSPEKASQRYIDHNMWEESREHLKELGVDNPTNQEIQAVDSAAAQENNINVVNPDTNQTLWPETGGGQTKDISMMKGLIKWGAAHKTALAIKAARLGVKAATGF